jgi:transposase
MKDRNNPKRGTASESQYTIVEFMREFPDDAACLDWLWRTRYAADGEHARCPRCGIVRSFRRYATTQRRQSWTCTTCGLHLHPTAGTIFHKSATSLHLWFYGIYLMTSTRSGISAKQLERELGVTYKTAWRMFHLIRGLLGDNATALIGRVEVDETYVGGRPRHRIHGDMPAAIRQAMANKVEVQGMVERGGIIRAVVNPTHPLLANVVEHVMPGSMVYTDEASAYRRLPKRGYAHRRVHHLQHVYVSGDAHTNTIEGFWSLMKRGISGVYHAVSAKYLQMYVDEYTFRYNHRNDGGAMFRTVANRAASSV